ncbi:MAG TPA: hypothetical protein VNK82_07325, partial [Terriglobales bacterium]|nr:hypothetical protein [Terriglobales bacterium]
MEANLEQGLKPYGQYQGGDIDSVSLTSGNLVLHIPLVSYPQRGQNLTLDFQIVYNNKSWEVKFYPIPPENGYLKWTWRGSGPTVVKDQHLRIKWVVEVFDDGSGNPITFNHHSAVSPDGAEHELNTISSSTYLSLDGTGIRYEAGSSPQVAIDRNGVRYLLNGFSGSFTKYANPSSAEDPNGNKITTGSSYTDTLGRVIPARVSTTNLTNCPSGTLDAELWNLPAPSGGTATLKFCFKSFSLQTSFGASGVQEGTASPRLLWAVVLPDLTKWLFNYNTYGDLTSITLPTGGTITYSWGNASFSSCVEPATPKSRVVLSRTLNANDGSGAKTWSYTWGSAIGGDDVNVVTDPDGNDTAHTIGALNCAPLVTRTQYFQGSRASGVVLRTVETTYVAPAPSSYAGGMPTAIKTTLEDGKVSKVVNTYDIDHGLGFSWYDQNDPGIFYTGSYGNVIRRSEYDFGQGAPGPFVRRTLTDYRAFEATGTSYKTANLLDLVSATTVFSDAGETQQKARTEYKYDESSLQPSGITTQRNASPPGPRGNLTTVRRWLNPGGTYLSSPTTYFDTGMVYQAKDPLLHTTTYTYSSAFAGAYPTQIQYPTTGSTTHIVSRNYDFNTGLLTSATDENNQTMTFVYDNMFRQTQENRPDSGQTTWAYTNSAPFKVTATAKITSTMNLVSEAEVDGLGRVKQTRLTSDPEGTVYVDTTYDNVGRKKTVSNPYRSTGESTYGITEYQYDALGRVTKVIPPDGSPTANNVTTTYAGPTVTVTDQAGKVRKSETDALGRLIRVWEPNASGSLVNKTRYFYDTLDNLACVLQLGTDAEPTNCASPNANWRPRTFVYDSLSRLTSATNPESGTITYTYDNDGNVLTKVAPKPNQQGTLTVTTTYTYDALHRLTQNSYNDGATATVKYGYDGVALTGCTTAPPALTIANGKGRRTAMCDASGATSWSYDPLGRTLTEKRTIMGSSAVTKTIGYDYNFDGSLKTLTYPSGRVITYTPSAAGRTVSAVDTANGINYATGALYAPHGALRSLANGASLVSTFYYNNRLQPCRISVKSSGTAPTDCANASIGNVMDFTYNFDQDWGAGVKNNGNVASINNNRNLNRGQRFTYDELNR